MRKLLLILFISYGCITISLAQENSVLNIQQQYRITVKRTTDQIHIDGELNEASWKSVKPASEFWVKWPADGRKARRSTIVSALHDDHFLYIGAILYDSGQAVIQTLKRDSRYWESDGIGIIIDPVNQHTNGFFFGVSPYNVQAEDMLASIGTEMNFSWDNKWFSETKRFADHWTVEVAIPFKTLRYEPGKTEWGINFLRNEPGLSEFHSWTPVPVNFNGTNLNYTGLLQWETSPPKPGSNISVAPYITGSVSQDNLNGEGTTGKFNGGFDSKIAITSSLNLDLTVNPDFSQIEVDRQVTNLTRFNIFFPERRNFFLENSDLFAAYGSGGIRPFYSRTIGLDENGKTVPILGGARISGNLTKNLRIGIMNMQTEGKEGTPSRNYSAVSVHQKVFANSSIRGYFFNRQSSLTDEAEKENPMDRYGRNAGGEFVYANKAGTWMGWSGFHQSFKPGITDKDKFYNVGGGHFGKNVQVILDYIDAGTNFYTDMGFSGRLENYDAVRDTVIRQGIKQINNGIELTFRPKQKSKINVHSIGLNTNIVLNPDGTFNERVNVLGYFIEFKNTSVFRVAWDNQDVSLQYPISFTGKTPLPKGDYLFNQYSVAYTTDIRKKFVFGASFRVGQFYNGDYQQYIASVTYRAQPWGNFSIEFEQNDLKFPDPYGQTNLFLISPRIEISFSNKMSWTTFLQYNTQQNNFNINSRFQWRFRPMSDLYVVYTDNYFTDPLFKNKNRALVFKMNYWLNL